MRAVIRRGSTTRASCAKPYDPTELARRVRSILDAAPIGVHREQRPNLVAQILHRKLGRVASRHLSPGTANDHTGHSA